MSSAGPSATSPVLVLWDIDHTLIETRGVGFAIYQRAFAAATGRAFDKRADISGRTELDIMRERRCASMESNQRTPQCGSSPPHWSRGTSRLSTS